MADPTQSSTENPDPAGESLQNSFLVSMPQLNDPNFHKTVVLICKHDASGTVGIVVNRPTDNTLNDIYSQLDIEPSSPEHGRANVMDGGPVFPELGLVIHNGSSKAWESSLKIGDDLYLTSSRDIIESIAQGEGPEKMLMSVGYAGWGPGQLEMEIQENAWLTVPADQSILFSGDDAEKWQSSAKLIGIDIHRISANIGHA